jgi:group I intron endonuclease
MEEMGSIYLITNKKTKQTYVGQYRDPDPTPRWRRHIRLSRICPYLLHRALHRYGVDAFTFEVLMICPESSLDTMEAYWAEQFGSYFTDRNDEGFVPGGYNMIWCGGFSRRGLKHSAESIAKSVAKTTGLKRTEETKALMSIRSKGRKKTPEQIEKHRQSLIGFKHTEATKAKMRARLRPKWSPESRAKLSLSKTGVPRSLETRANMSKARKGVPRSPETKARMAANKKPPTEKQLSQLAKARESIKPHTDEAKERMSSAKKEWWAQKKALLPPKSLPSGPTNAYGVNNRLGIPYISQTKSGFRFKIQHKGVIHQKTLKTQEDAISYRDEYFALNPSHVRKNLFEPTSE